MTFQLPPLPVRAYVPSRLNVAAWIQLAWPTSRRSTRVWCRSQMRTSLSSPPPVTTVWPSGATASALTQSMLSCSTVGSLAICGITWPTPTKPSEGGMPPLREPRHQAASPTRKSSVTPAITPARPRHLARRLGFAVSLGLPPVAGFGRAFARASRHAATSAAVPGQAHRATFRAGPRPVRRAPAARAGRAVRAGPE